VQIKRILLRKYTRIRREITRINAKQDFDEPHVAMLNLNPYISTKKMQCNLGIPYAKSDCISLESDT